jgi:hypothetical protein
VAEQRGARPRPAVKWPLAAVAAILLSLGVSSITVAGVFRDIAPETVMRFAPFDGRSRAAAAMEALGQRPDRAIALRAVNLARAAFLADATAVASYPAAAGGFAILGQSRRSIRLLEYSERFSRRHAPTQIALIELRVQQDDVAGALRHYDTILRATERVQPLLFPVLTNAAADPSIADQLNRRLRARPRWHRQFLPFFLGASRSPEALYRVFRGVLDPGDEEHRELGRQLLSRLSDARRFDLVSRLHSELSRERDTPIQLLRDGSFEVREGWPPIDWQFADEAALAAERLPTESGEGFALHLPTAAGADGTVARQLLRLPPGAYELRALVGNIPADELRRPFLRMACAAGNWAIQLDLPAAPSGELPIARRAVVPSGCAYQWLSIHARGGLDDALGQAPWISSLSLRRL